MSSIATTSSTVWTWRRVRLLGDGQPLPVSCTADPDPGVLGAARCSRSAPSTRALLRTTAAVSVANQVSVMVLHAPCCSSAKSVARRARHRDHPLLYAADHARGAPVSARRLAQQPGRHLVILSLHSSRHRAARQPAVALGPYLLCCGGCSWFPEAFLVWTAFVAVVYATRSADARWGSRRAVASAR